MSSVSVAVKFIDALLMLSTSTTLSSVLSVSFKLISLLTFVNDMTIMTGHYHQVTLDQGQQIDHHSVVSLAIHQIISSGKIISFDAILSTKPLIRVVNIGSLSIQTPCSFVSSLHLTSTVVTRMLQFAC